jgi:CopA family copper-resistance protein
MSSFAAPLHRRRFVQGLAVLGGLGAGVNPSSLFARGAGPNTLTGSRFDLSIGETPVNITGRPRMATVVNGLMPGPSLRWREGDTVTLNVTNRMKEATSIHWHGIRSPAQFDGVPGLSFRGIMPGETFTYTIPVKQAGTYWYHSHSGMQEQTGLYGSIVIAPKDADPHPYDREHVILLSDWTDEDPMTVVANLKQQGDYYNYHQRTVGTLASDIERQGLRAAVDKASMWLNMRMTPTDLLDVTGATYTYLANGAPPRANWTGLFKPGERVRLRIINGSSMTFFDVRIPGLTMTVVQTDGYDVHPVPVDEFRIGVAETYDVIVTPTEDRAYTVFAQSLDRTGYARATLAPRLGMAAPVPPMDPVPVRTMKDMGMGDMKMAGMDMSGPKGAPVAMAGMDMSGSKDAMAGMDMSGSKDTMAGMDMGGSKAAMPGMAMRASKGAIPTTDASGVNPAELHGAINVDNVAMHPENRLADKGIGLGGAGRRVLVYTDLKALRPGPDQREPSRDIVFHLKLGERVRFTLINDTMMEHPIHLHGLFSEIENGQAEDRPLKHTVTVKPGEKMSYLVSADTPGHWAFHCHLLYHMETGMFRTVIVS